MLWLESAREGNVDDEDGRVLWRRHQDDELGGGEKSTSAGASRGGSGTTKKAAMKGKRSFEPPRLPYPSIPISQHQQYPAVPACPSCRHCII